MKNVAILGASGIGRFHVREFRNAGCNVRAILGSTQESCQKTKALLKKDFGIDVNTYTDLTDLLTSEELDAVSVCTPPEMHEDNVRAALKSNLDVFCEKPLIFNNESYRIARELHELAEQRNKVLTVNTQWVSIIDLLKSQLKSDIKEFSMLMQLGIKGSRELFREGISHTLSLTISLLGLGDMENLSISENSEERVVIDFNYNGAKIKHTFEYRLERPRKLEFVLNGQEFSREVGENYSQKIVSKNSSTNIEDPLTNSITSFVRGKPLVNKESSLQNLIMQDIILKELEK